MHNITTIAICDDNAWDRSRIREHVRMHLVNDDVLIHEYASGKDLISAMEEVRYLLIFLDIQMEGLDGNETAVKIRELDNHVLLVFYTGYAEPSPWCFEVQPYRYIMKNMPDEKVGRYVKDSLDKMNEVGDMPVLEARMDGMKLFLKPDDIVYIEKYMKTTRVYITKTARRLYPILSDDNEEDLEIRISDRLDSLYAILKNYGFGCPHNSYIINFKYLTACKTYEFCMREAPEKLFRLTRSKAQEFNKQKHLFMTLKYGRGKLNDI